MPIYIVTAFHKEFFDELADVKRNNIPFELVRKSLQMNDIQFITQSILGDEQCSYL